jgi:hypothetical protein
MIITAALILQIMAFPESWFLEEPTQKSTLLATIPLERIDILKLNPGYAKEEDIVPLAWEQANMTRDLPGIGSGLLIDPVTHSLIAITDRGANNKCEGGKGIVMPKFAPTMVTSRLEANSFRVVHSTMLRGKQGPIVGIANFDSDEKMFDTSCTNLIPSDRRGLDTEDVQMHPNGIHYFTSEEYSPSIVVYDATGAILMRYVPSVLEEQFKGFDDYPISATLPGIFRERRDNRGIESMAISKDGNTLWAILQSPMGNPKSRIIRALKLDSSDPVNLKTIGMFAFEASDPKEYIDLDGKRGKANDLKISSAQIVKGDMLVIGERVDDSGLRLITVDFTDATNLMGTRAETELLLEDSTMSHEFQLGKTNIVFDTADLSEQERRPLLDKMEGIAILSPASILVISDNDFGLAGLDTLLFAVSLTSKLPIPNNFLSPLPAYELSDSRGHYFKIPGPADREVLNNACKIRGARLLRVIEPQQSIQQGIVPNGKMVVSGSGICIISTSAY